MPELSTTAVRHDRIQAGAALRPFALLGVAVSVFITQADLDLWGHLRFGLDMLASGRLSPADDPYSFTQDRAWLNHEWLSEVATGAAYSLGSVPGLLALKLAIVAAVLWLVWGGLRTAPFTWRWAGMALVAWQILPLTVTLRPQLWSGLGLAVLCRVLTSGSPQRSWVLPLLFAAWVNLHGGWIVGGGVLALWVAAEWLQGSPARIRLTLVGATCLAATLVNPYGVHLWQFLGETVRFGRDRIVEWQAIWDIGAITITLWGITAITIAASVRRWGRPALPAVFILCWLAIASAFVIRLLPLFALATVMLLSRQWHDSSVAPLPQQRARAAMEGFAVALFVVAMLWSGRSPVCFALPAPSVVDTAAAEALRGARGRLVTHFNSGQYALWHFGPALQVSMDGRRETIYTDTVLAEQIAIADGTAPGRRALERLRPEYVWLPAASRGARGWLVELGYRLDVETEHSFVATRGDVAPLVPWSSQSSGCFPGP